MCMYARVCMWHIKNTKLICTISADPHSALFSDTQKNCVVGFRLLVQGSRYYIEFLQLVRIVTCPYHNMDTELDMGTVKLS